MKTYKMVFDDSGEKRSKYLLANEEILADSKILNNVLEINPGASFPKDSGIIVYHKSMNVRDNAKISEIDFSEFASSVEDVLDKSYLRKRDLDIIKNNLDRLID